MQLTNGSLFIVNFLVEFFDLNEMIFFFALAGRMAESFHIKADLIVIY
jgi:hypothetical protein